MKRLITAFMVIVITLLCGCDTAYIQSSETTQSSELCDTRDSCVDFACYPKNCSYGVVDKFDRPQFCNLTDIQKSLYIIMDNAVFEMQTGYVDLGVCSYRDLELAYFAMRRDRPEYFWLSNEYSLKQSGDRRMIRFAETDKDWLFSAVERADTEALIRDSIVELYAAIGEGKSEYERELAVHDAVCEMTEYDQAAAGDPSLSKSAWNVAGVFDDGSAVCEGYAKAMQLLCFSVGINCGLITGNAESPHMWNYVKIGGSWYHIDVTADDCADTPYMAFFNVTTESISKGRTIDREARDLTDEQLESGTYNCFVPPCNSTEYNYFAVNGLYIADMSQLEPTFVSMVGSYAKEGRKSAEFYLDPQLGFVYGETPVSNILDVSRCISDINELLPKSDKIVRYTVEGITGSCSFRISW